MGNETAVRQSIADLFSLMQIRRVICVDDEHENEASIEEVYGLCVELGPKVKSIPELRTIEFNVPEVIWKASLNTLWDALPEEQRKFIGRRLRGLSEYDKSHDAFFSSVLIRLLGNQEFEYLELTPSEWEQDRKRWINEAEQKKTLFLFDQKLGANYREGVELIESVLSEVPNSKTIICGLLSHTFDPGQVEFERWREYLERPGLKNFTDQFTLISKGHLEQVRDKVAPGFVGALRRVVLNHETQEFKLRVSSILEEVNQAAISQLNDINIYDFEHIVFRSSYDEGVWEPDTLFRLFGIFHRAEALKRARLDQSLQDRASILRQVSQIRTIPTDPPLSTYEIQRLEWYDEISTINTHHMPLELGDIFEAINENGTQLLVLLAQPCDLMVRKTGIRDDYYEATLAEITITNAPNDKRDAPGHYYLKYYGELTLGRHYVKFARTHSVPLHILDMCVYNTDGVAKFNPGIDCPAEVIPAWKSHYKEMVSFFEPRLIKCVELRSLPHSEEIYLRALPNSDYTKLFKPSIDFETNTISYNLRRVRRIRQPHAGDMLKWYANFIARTAFDHDFGEMRNEIRA